MKKKICPLNKSYSRVRRSWLSHLRLLISLRKKLKLPTLSLFTALCLVGENCWQWLHWDQKKGIKIYLQCKYLGTTATDVLYTVGVIKSRMNHTGDVRQCQQRTKPKDRMKTEPFWDSSTVVYNILHMTINVDSST